MSFRTTIALLFAAALIVAFYVFVERERPTTEEIEKTAKRLVSKWKSDDVLKVTIARAAPEGSTPSANVVVEREKGGKWRIVEPIRAIADQSELDGMLSSVEYAERKEALIDFDPKAIGLDRPRIEVRFSFADGATRALQFGLEDMTGKNVYVRVAGRDGAFLVAKYVCDRLDKKIDDLREKALFSVDRWRVERVALKGREVELSFKKDGDYWLMDRPVEDFADKQKVEDLLGALHGLRAKRFVEDSPRQLARYGLEPPRAIATLEGGGSSETALLGEKTAESASEIYARRAPSGATPTAAAAPSEADSPVVAVDDQVSAKIVWDVDQWRSKSLVHVGRDRIEALTVTTTAAPGIRLTHLSTGWRFLEPKPVAAEAQAVDDLVRAIQEVEVAGVVAARPADLANYGLDRSTIVTLETPKLKHGFRLGKPSRRDDGYYVQREGKEAVLEVVFPKAKELLAAYPLLRDRKLFDFAAGDVARLEFARKGEAPRPYVRMPDGTWRTPGGEPDGPALESLASDLGALRVERISCAPADLAQAGLKEPWLTVRIARRSVSSGEEIATIDLGKTGEKGDFNARIEWQGEIFHVGLTRELADRLDRDYTVKPASGAPQAPTGTAEPATGAAQPAPAAPGSPPPAPGETAAAAPTTPASPAPAAASQAPEPAGGAP